MNITHRPRRRRAAATILAAVGALVAFTAVGARQAAASATGFDGAAAYDQDSLIVVFDRGVPATTGRAAVAAAGVGSVKAGGPRSVVVEPRAGESLKHAAGRIAKSPGVDYVKPNYTVRVSDAFVPNDPGKGVPGDWSKIQWNLVGDYGVNALPAWGRLRDLGLDGGRGAVVAVIDTGVAYESVGRYRRSPDLANASISGAYDFIDRDRHANDRNGHGTHVASTIVQDTNNGIGVAGLAYGATLMPIRALDGAGLGDEMTVARAIRYAARKRADIINLSVEFDVRLSSRDLPTIVSAMRYARQKGSLVVAAAGNQAARRVAYPARSPYALAVGATTIHGCLADYSDVGSGLDLVAPGGGADSGVVDLRRGSTDRENCGFNGQPSPIYQITFGRSLRRFGLPGGYQGTSMATPHVSGTAALIIASGIIGPDPTPAALTEHMAATARDLGFPGFDTRYGWGLVDAGRAVTPPAAPPVAPTP